MRNKLLGLTILSLMVALTDPVAARDTSTPSPPTTKAGKCAKANGGYWVPERNGWFTLDLLNYRKCMAS